MSKSALTARIKQRELAHHTSKSTPRHSSTDVVESPLRAQLAMEINSVIKLHDLTQAEVANIFSIPQPHVSELKHYKLARFSSERLMRFLTLLDQDVEIVIRSKTDNASSYISIVVAR